MDKKVIILTTLFLCVISSALSQVNVRDSTARGFIFNFNLGYNFPAGDVSELYSPHMSFGFDVFYKTKSNWLLGGGLDYMFGTNVKNPELLLADFITEDGKIIGTNGDYTSVKPFMRGWVFQAKVGKIFPIIGPNPNSGLLVQLGAGYIQHRTQLDHFNSVLQLNEPYDKGYDQLHTGFALSEYIAFFHAGNKRTVNFQLGLNFTQGFTQNAREYNYHTRSFDLDKKLDLFFGIKACWFLPIYDKNAQKFFYN
jgi:hypothetical protein